MNFRALFLAALLSSAAGSANALIDGTTYGVISPTYTSTGLGANSYIRLFSGAGKYGALSTFTVTIQGASSGTVYGSPLTISVPYGASVQFLFSDLLRYAGAGALTGTDTTYAVYLKNSDPEAGYQHVTYSQGSNLFENLSNCVSPLNERMILLHNTAVLTNVHTSKVASNTFPSTIYLYNYAVAQANYEITILNSGGATTNTTTATANSGKYTCQYNVSVAPNSIAAIPESTLETTAGCTIDSDQSYDTLLIRNTTGTTNVSATHLVSASAYGGQSNLTDVCAVNKASLSTSALALVFSAAAGTTFPLTAPLGIQSINITGLSQTPSGGAVFTGALATSPTGSLVTSSTGFSFTMPSGKTVTYNTTPGNNNFSGLNHYEALTSDGTRNIDLHIGNERVTGLGSSTYGYYAESDASTDDTISVGTFATGVASTTAQIPTTGTGTYTGSITGIIGTTADTGSIVGGTVTITVNYATKAVTGSITGITTLGIEGTTPGTMSSLNLTGTSTTTGSISGTVSAGAAGTKFNLTGLTGTFNAAFYSSSAFEIAGTIPIQSNGTTLLATFGAHK